MDGIIYLKDIFPEMFERFKKIKKGQYVRNSKMTP